MSNGNTNYKRILIIIFDSNLTSNSATDITLRSYFREWPKDKLLILTSENTNKPFANTIVLKSYFIEWLREKVSKFLLRENKGVDNRNLVPGAIIKSSNNRLGLNQKLFAIGAAYEDMLYVSTPKRTLKAIDNFKPEAIYTIMDSIKTNKLAVKFSKRYNIPIVPHFMDDWISTTYTGSFWLKLARSSLTASLKKLLNRAKIGFCISQKMCDEYEYKFNKKFLPLMNIVKLDPSKKYRNENKSVDLVFTYFGGLHLNRWKSLEILSEVLEDLSREIQKKLLLEIYTTEDNINKYYSQFRNSIVSFKRFIDHDAAIMKMQQSDFLVHVESFDESVIKFTRLSISTKIPEYLASDTPIIAIGPSNIASIEYLRDNNCAYIITKLNRVEIKNILLAAFNGVNNEIYSKNNFQLVKKNHSFSQSILFRKVLESV